MTDRRCGHPYRALIARLRALSLLLGLVLATAATAPAPTRAQLPVTAADLQVQLVELRDTLSQIWVNQRLPNGAFANPFPPDLAAGHAGFNPAMLLYGIERSGERRRRFDWLASIAPSWPYTVRVDRATAFDALGVAYAYSRLGLPQSLREVLAQWLRGYSIPALGGLCIRRSACYGNLKLVDALAVNVYDVMSHATVVLSQDALSRVVETLK